MSDVLMSPISSECSTEDKDEKHFVIQRGATCKDASVVEVRRFVQTILSRSINLSTLIGSGASTPAIPLMGKTFRGLRESLRESDPDTSSLLEERISALADKAGTDASSYSDIEQLLSWLNQRIEGALDTAEGDKRVSDVVKDAFLKSVNVDYEESFSDVLDNYRKVIQGLGVSRQLLARGGQNTFDVINLFTTNYDLFHELALETSGYAYSDGFANGSLPFFSPREFHRRPIDLEERFRDHYEPVTPFFRLYKLHGSVNWRNLNGSIVRIPRLPGADEFPLGESQLIAPVTSKYALTQGSPYSDIFREFVNTLAAPNTVLMACGFSFADSHISNLVKQALARPDFTLLAFISDPKKMEIGSPSRAFYDETGSANTYFVYPKEDGSKQSGPLFFSEFAEFVGPEITFGDDTAAQSLELGSSDVHS